MNPRTTFPVTGKTVVIAAVAINLILGVLYAWGVLAKALIENWHWTKTQATHRPPNTKENHACDKGNDCRTSHVHPTPGS